MEGLGVDEVAGAHTQDVVEGLEVAFAIEEDLADGLSEEGMSEDALEQAL